MLKLTFLAIFSITDIVSRPKMNAAIKADPASIGEKVEDFVRAHKPAMATAGMLIKKLNLIAEVASYLLKSRADNVKPDLLKPGRTANPWAIPAIIASIFEGFLLEGVMFFEKNKTRPVIISNTPISNIIP